MFLYQRRHSIVIAGIYYHMVAQPIANATYSTGVPLQQMVQIVGSAGIVIAGVNSFVVYQITELTASLDKDIFPA